ncbi:MAG: 2,3-bisphosphoglycerate-independent phosphoglycerate mutase [Bacillota bacterium]|nr:2,3-bisphosphoglycerate-independent phosphoglycerate mutase [Bacillota bacterium]MDW7682913.1 2,3-bisphosphoglycerate-independent phosphoglycerate mutase [Bacillota bacterium]
MSRPRPLVLIVMDGWGLGRKRIGNAIYQADTPFYHHLLEKYPVARLKANGEEVGLPEGQMGNSEVGHLNIGAGRIVYQELTRISKAIDDSVFFENKELLLALSHVKSRKSALHLMGLVSDGGVHSHLRHLYALLELAKRHDVEDVYIHAILDGRDVGPTSAREYLKELEDKVRELATGKVATVSGRYYAMDRDKRWERVELAYNAMVHEIGEKAAGSLHALETAYERDETDEFVRPTVLLDEQGHAISQVAPDDAIIFFNFRPDRARQITRAFTDRDFNGFDRGDNPPLPYFVCMTQYDEHIRAPVAFPPNHPENTLGEVIAQNGLTQLRIAETEKYAHVTFFFSGGEEKSFDGEERILVQSPKVATYNLKPEMSAPEVTERVLHEINENHFDFIVLNYANADMVGHTGVVDAAVAAIECVDRCLEKVVGAVLAKDGIAIVTADHGNAEQMTSGRNHSPFTAHTPNPVPFIMVSNTPYRLHKSGILADVAPTILELLELPRPSEMTGNSLLIRTAGKRNRKNA